MGPRRRGAGPGPDTVPPPLEPSEVSPQSSTSGGNGKMPRDRKQSPQQRAKSSSLGDAVAKPEAVVPAETTADESPKSLAPASAKRRRGPTEAAQSIASSEPHGTDRKASKAHRGASANGQDESALLVRSKPKYSICAHCALCIFSGNVNRHICGRSKVRRCANCDLVWTEEYFGKHPCDSPPERVVFQPRVDVRDSDSKGAAKADPVKMDPVADEVEVVYEDEEQGEEKARSSKSGRACRAAKHGSRALECAADDFLAPEGPPKKRSKQTSSRSRSVALALARACPLVVYRAVG